MKKSLTKSIVLAVLIILSFTQVSAGLTDGDETKMNIYMKDFEKTKEEITSLKAQLGTWDEVKIHLSMEKLGNDKKKIALSEDRVLWLYRKGFMPIDIKKAEELSLFTNKLPEEILWAKGRDDCYELVEITGNDGKIQEVVKKVVKKPWDNVISEVQIDLDTICVKTGINKGKLEQLRKSHTLEQITDAVFLSIDYEKKYDDVLNDMNSGNNRLKLMGKYKAEKEILIKQKSTYKISRKEEVHVEPIKITDEDTKSFKSFGITEIEDQIYLKTISVKYKVELEKVLDINKNDNIRLESILEGMEGRE